MSTGPSRIDHPRRECIAMVCFARVQTIAGEATTKLVLTR